MGGGGILETQLRNMEHDTRVFSSGLRTDSPRPRVRPRVPIRRSKLSLKRAFSKKNFACGAPRWGSRKQAIIPLGVFKKAGIARRVLWGELDANSRASFLKFP